MNYLDTFNLWLHSEFFDENTRNELALLNIEKDKKEIEDRFYKNLEFGTGGLRGIMGAGTNRMNKYTVGKATMGLGKYLLNAYGAKVCRECGVVIGYDTRNNSKYFSQTAADVLSSMGILVYLYSDARPTPQLSFSIKFWGALAGVVITASHNSKEYNGYKIYDRYGCQLVPWQVEKIIGYIDEIENYQDIDFSGNVNLIQIVDATDDFVTAVLEQSCYKNEKAKNELNIVYTPLYGTGNIPVRKVLQGAGFKNVKVVDKQAIPDGDFPNLVTPNPEDGRALELGISLAKKLDADVVLGTDPDGDRVGIAIKTNYNYQLLTGNQVGALLVDFLLNHIELKKYNNPAIIKTIVSSELGAEIAHKKGISVFSTLTGFKYIGEKITQFEQAKLTGEKLRDYDFIFGYEESYGYLAGNHTRDKDATVSCLLICEMAAALKAQGKTLLERMNELYELFGYYKDAMDSFTLKGKDGLEKISLMMSELRCGKPLFGDVKQVIDYITPVEAEEGFGTLPAANVLKYVLKDDSWVAIRPSNTEPKIKIYYNIKAGSKRKAELQLGIVRQVVKKRLNL